MTDMPMGPLGGAATARATTRPATTGLLTRADEVGVGLQVALGLMALLSAAFTGFAQAIDRVGVQLFAFYPFIHHYYQNLSAHGVFNALIFTFGFSNGFMLLVHCRSVARRPNTGLLWGSAAGLYLGAFLMLWKIAANEASVLYTMYPPLKAHPLYYVGAALLVVSTLLTGLNVFVTYRSWRRAHPSAKTPLQAFMVVATYAMWTLASVGVVVEVLFFLLPWSLGWTETIDAQFARSLFWYTGHPIVYFWLLPAYVSWYTMIPAQTGGKLFSDPLARLTFLTFLLLSTPVGFHHQYTDPGISQGMKVVHLVLTFGVFLPSMATAFSVVAALENAGRARGGEGLLGWIRKLRWDDPSVSAQLLAMFAFTFGGITGLVNASYNLNLVIHNTAWVPGHFHLTIGTAVALSLMGVSYWLVPHLTGRALWGRRLALAQGWLWLVGVLVFARGQISGGLEGMPRRTWLSQATYQQPTWELSNQLTAIGGTLMFVSLVTFGVILLGTLVLGARAERPPMPVAEALAGPETEWPLLERWGVWVGAAVALVIVSYGPYLATTFPLESVSTGFQLW